MAKDFSMDVSTNEELTSEDASQRENPKSIRNITLDERKNATRMDGVRQNMVYDEPVSPRSPAPKFSSRGSRPAYLLWGIAGLALLIVGGAGALTLMGETEVMVTPRVHTITFDPAMELSAQPENSGTSTLTYKVVTTTFEESAVVPAKGVAKVQEKASGSLTVYNEYSDAPVKLIKNTRFQSSSGLIFRIPSSIEIPGRKNGTPGQLVVTVFADVAGPEYNINPDKFSVPGLKNTPDMYSGVYARSSSAFTGGFIGDRPAVDPKVLAATKTDLQAKLKLKAAAPPNIEQGLIVSSLSKVTYDSLPTTSEQGGGVKVTERATVRTPVLDAGQFAQTVARTVAADSDAYTITAKPNAAFAITADTKKSTEGGSLFFSLSGGALLTWSVQAEKVAEALAGRDDAAFESIISGFSSIDHAEARLSPFWRSTFPDSPTDIRISVQEEGKSE